MDDLNCDFYQINCFETQVMWRIFEAKPRTRLGRLSHARTHDDILDLVGDDDDIYVAAKGRVQIIKMEI